MVTFTPNILGPLRKGWSRSYLGPKFHLSWLVVQGSKGLYFVFSNKFNFKMVHKFKPGKIEVIDMIVGSGRVDQETVHVGRLPGRPPPAELIWVQNAAY